MQNHAILFMRFLFTYSAYATLIGLCTQLVPNKYVDMICFSFLFIIYMIYLIKLTNCSQYYISMGGFRTNSLLSRTENFPSSSNHCYNCVL